MASSLAASFLLPRVAVVLFFLAPQVWPTQSIGSVSEEAVSPGVFDARAYGARGDSKTDNTIAIRKAIAAAHTSYGASGKSRPTQVVLTDGTYVSGQVELLDGVHLNITEGTVLRATDDLRSFPFSHQSARVGIWGVVFANHSRNVGLVGGGTVDGDFAKYVKGFDEANVEFVPKGWPGCLPTNDTSACRPKLVYFDSSVDVVVDSVTLIGSAFWTFHLQNCSRVAITNMHVIGDPRFPNNDGIDIDSSQHVSVSDSSIDTADDGVCIKSTRGAQDTAFITVRNTKIRSRSSAIKFGSTTPTDIHDILFDDILIHDSNGGVSIQARDEGTISNVVFRNVDINGTRQWPGRPNADGDEWGGWWGSGENLWISTMPRTPSSVPGRVRNVTYENVWGVGQNANFLSGALHLLIYHSLHSC